MFNGGFISPLIMLSFCIYTPSIDSVPLMLKTKFLTHTKPKARIKYQSFVQVFESFCICVPDEKAVDAELSDSY